MVESRHFQTSKALAGNKRKGLLCAWSLMRRSCRIFRETIELLAILLRNQQLLILINIRRCLQAPMVWHGRKALTGDQHVPLSPHRASGLTVPLAFRGTANVRG